MKTKKLQLTPLLVLLLMFANFNLATGQNMNRWIELSVTQGDSIRLGFAADAENTPVKIVSGTYSQTITVGTTRPSSFSEAKKYFAKATSMRIYGNLNYFDCGLNESKVRGLDVSHNTGLEHLFCSKNSLTSLDVSQNTALKFLSCFDNLLTSLDISQNTALNALYCYRNRFSRQALDDIYCALPQKVPANNAKICVLYDYRDAGYDIVIATNKQNAIAKNWKVKSMISTDIPATTGTYTCPPVSYGIEIAGTELTSDNMGAINNSNFPGLGLESGSITYNHPTRTFTFSNVTANTDVHYLFTIKSSAYADKFTINLEGTNTIITTGFYGIVTDKELEIKGSGWLKVVAQYSAFYVRTGDGYLKIIDTKVEAKGKYGFAGAFGTYGEKLLIRNSTVKATGSTYGSIRDFQEITIDNCDIVKPQGATVAANGSSGMAVMLGGQPVKELVEIRRKCPPVTNLTASVGYTNRVILNWELPPQSEWPTGCVGDLHFDIYNGDTHIGYSYTDDLTTYTTPQLLPGDHLIKVKLSYNDANHHFIASATTEIEVTAKTPVPTDFGAAAKEDYTALLYWMGPLYEAVRDCDGDMDYYFYDDGTLIGQTEVDYTDKWRTPKLSVGTHELGLKVEFYDTNKNLIATSDMVTVWLDVKAKPASNLTATINDDYTVTLNWNNPTVLPLDCEGDVDFYFYDGDTEIGYSTADNITSWTTPVLSAGTHTLGVKIDYYDASSSFICESAKATVSATVKPSASVNMSRYIELTVKPGSSIMLSLMADAKDTPVKVVSGTAAIGLRASSEYWTESTHIAQVSTMRVYGDVAGFDCSEKGSNVTGLDVSHNTALEQLSCYGNQLTTLDVSQNTALEFLDCSVNQLTALDVSTNTALKQLFCGDNNFTSQAIDDIYCALPHRQAADNAIIYPLFDSTDTNHALVLATNKQNAIDKNWKVQYINTYEDIPATTGTYMCGGSTPPVNMNRYIELTVTPGSNIWFALYAQQSDTPVKIVSGTAETPLRATEDWIELTHIAQAGTIRVYGDVAGFDCGDNEPNVTGLDVSHNTALEYLSCYGNQLTTLNVSQNTALIGLYCQDNQLTTLDVSKNTALKKLWCLRNSLSALDISQNTALIELLCDGNNLTTQAIDDIYCSLPQRQPADNAKIYPVDNPTDINHALVLATNKQNAINKGWRVLYRNDTDIPATTGTYVCTTTGVESVESAVSIYPNPAKDFITIATDDVIGSAITITDLAGRTVMTTTATDTMTTLDVSRLGAGTYIIRVGDKTAKIVKM